MTCHSLNKPLSSLTCQSRSEALSLSWSLTLSISKKLYKCWSSKACASGRSSYQRFFVSDKWAWRQSLRLSSHWQSREWSGKRIADWMQLDLLLARQHQSFFIDTLSKDNSSRWCSNPKMRDKSKLVARLFSSHDCIWAQMNGRTKHAIYEWSELCQWQIRPIKVRSVKTIASFDSHANHPSVQFMSEMNCLKNRLDKWMSDW